MRYRPLIAALYLKFQVARVSTPLQALTVGWPGRRPRSMPPVRTFAGQLPSGDAGREATVWRARHCLTHRRHDRGLGLPPA